MVFCSGLNKGPIEEVSVVGDKYMRPHLQNVRKEALNQSFLVRRIVDREISLQVCTRGVLKILNIRRHNFPVGDQISLIKASIISDHTININSELVPGHQSCKKSS